MSYTLELLLLALSLSSFIWIYLDSDTKQTIKQATLEKMPFLSPHGTDATAQLTDMRNLNTGTPPTATDRKVRGLNEPTKSNSPPSHFLNQHQTGHQACLQGLGKTVQRKQRRIYQWTDSNGKKHLADAPPAHQPVQITSTEISHLDYFNLDIIEDQAVLPPFARDKFQSEIDQIYYVLKHGFNVRELRQIHIKLRLFDQRQDYIKYQKQHAPNLSLESSGFFSSHHQEAVVFTNDYAPQTFAITRHEITHAIMHSMYGVLPIWLNEGIAEYMESMLIQGQQRQAKPKEKQIVFLQEQLNNNNMMTLTEFIDLPYLSWYKTEQSRTHYAMAWSIIYWLQSSDQGKDFLQTLLNELGFAPCQRFNATHYIETHYPQGLEQFEQQWISWLNQKEHTAHHY